MTIRWRKAGLVLAAGLLAACTAAPGAVPPQRSGPSVAPQVSGPPLHVTAR